jgi:LysM repeat protein
MGEDVGVASSDDEDLAYTVCEGDTLESIAIAQGIPMAWLLEVNALDTFEVAPGDVLRFLEPRPELPVLYPIDAAIFRPREQTDLPGMLWLDGTFLRFQPVAADARPTVINLLGHLENAKMPHPRAVDSLANMAGPNAMHIIVMTYLKDPDNHVSMDTAYFAGRNLDLEIYKWHIDVTAEAAQRQHNFIAPNPNEIADRRPQSSATSVRLAARAVRLPPITLVGQSKIFESRDVDQVRAAMPIRFRRSNWRQLYQLSVHGCSYRTVYERVRKAEPLLLFIQTDSQDRIGAYLPVGLEESRDYYGGGETFVFRLTPAFHPFGWCRSPANRCFTLSTADELSLGGGGSAAIWLGQSFYEGYSDACATFAPAPLTAHRHFRVIDVEVWAVGEHVKGRLRVPVICT